MNGKLIVGLLGFLILGTAAQTQAAMLYMDPNAANLSRGDTVKVSIRLDTDEGECVNVVDGIVKYSDNIQPVDISRGASIMSMWVEDPVINRSNKTITFAGGIPNGYCGRIAGDPRLTNVVVDLLFRSPGFVVGGGDSDSNVAVISFDEQTQVLLNDGLGTMAPLALYGSSINLLDKPGGAIANEWKDIVNADVIYPEEFSITLERTSNAYSNDWFIVFNTTDKQSGIAHYEVIEESMLEASLFNWGREDAPWKEVKSPYVLKDQTLNSTIRVRALDKAGNEYVATYIPDEAQRTVATQTKIMIAVIATGIFVLLFGGVISAVIHLRRRKPDVVNADDEVVEDQETN